MSYVRRIKMINRSEVERFFMAVFAVCLSLFGALVFFDPVFNSRKYGVQVNFGECHQIIGLAMSSMGGIFIYLMARKKGPE